MTSHIVPPLTTAFGHTPLHALHPPVPRAPEPIAPDASMNRIPANPRDRSPAELELMRLSPALAEDHVAPPSIMQLKIAAMQERQTHAGSRGISGSDAAPFSQGPVAPRQPPI